MENMDDNVRVKRVKREHLHVYTPHNKIVNLLLNTWHMSKSSCKDR